VNKLCIMILKTAFDAGVSAVNVGPSTYEHTRSFFAGSPRG
jgi:hypothetical protein